MKLSATFNTANAKLVRGNQILWNLRIIDLVTNKSITLLEVFLKIPIVYFIACFIVALLGFCEAILGCMKIKWSLIYTFRSIFVLIHSAYVLRIYSILTNVIYASPDYLFCQCVVMRRAQVRTVRRRNALRNLPFCEARFVTVLLS